ncbi:MAG: GNAT family N-acetyltransferase [Bacteroidota bacterium]
MKIISLNKSNLPSEHICCALADAKNQPGVALKKQWLEARMDEGLVFKKMDVRGKVFIEYMPAELAWRPVEAPGYLFIHCLWVSGKYQGHGYAAQLLNACLSDAENKNGVAVICGEKPFLTGKKFFLKNGFEICDTAPPYFELLVKKFNRDTAFTRFYPQAKSLEIADKQGLVIYYSDQCPFVYLYKNEMAEAAMERGIKVEMLKINTAAEAQNMASAYGTFQVFLNGKFLTHQLMSRSGFGKLLDKLA